MMVLAQQKVSFRCQGERCAVFAEERRHTGPHGSTEDNSQRRKRQVSFLTLTGQLPNSPRVCRQFVTKIAPSALQLFARSSRACPPIVGYFSVGDKCFCRAQAAGCCCSLCQS